MGALTFVLLVLFGTEAVARDASAVQPGWDFTLPTLDGQRFVRLRAAPGPVLVNFWGVDCPPCVAELPLLLQWAADNPRWTLLLVSTDPPATARSFVARLPVAASDNVQWLRSGTAARTLLREAGTPQGGLPHSVALEPAQASACAAHSGTVDLAWLHQLSAACEVRISRQPTPQAPARP